MRGFAIAATVLLVGLIGSAHTPQPADESLTAENDLTAAISIGPSIERAGTDQPAALDTLPLRPDRVVMIPVGEAGTPLLGDWNGDRSDSPAFWFSSAGSSFLRFANGSILASTGSPDGVAVVGDFDGDGLDEVVTWDGVLAADATVLAGDWKGEGRDSVVVVPNGTASNVVSGDWDGDGRDTIAYVFPDTDGTVRVEFPDDQGSAPVIVDAAVGSVPVVGSFLDPILQDQLRRLRGEVAGRLPNRTTEQVASSLAPDGTELHLARVWGITVDRAIASNLERLLTDAFIDGIELAGWGWRSHDQQIELRRAHCGDSEYGIWHAPSHSCAPPTARPGLSRHEFGRAVDFTENGSVLTRSSPGFAWLQEHAADYGFINLPSEPWHWSDTGG